MNFHRLERSKWYRGTLLASVLTLMAAWPLTVTAAERIGAYFTQVNTYAYAKAPNEGPRVLLGPRMAYEVVDVTRKSDGTKWFQIVYPKRNWKIGGTGWISETPHEVLARPNETVHVLREIPVGPNPKIELVIVPTRDLKILTITKPSADFPQITWQKVQYSTTNPWKPWVRANNGIYRPGMSVSYMIEVYSAMVARNVPLAKLKRLLSGAIGVGDSVRDVEWALGRPLHIREEKSGPDQHTFWQYGAMVVQFENAVVKQFN